MTTWLKQSTAADVILGPFIDDTDFKTAKTALSIAQADIRLSKNGAAFAQTNNAAGATHREAGNYLIPLDTTDTNTLGRLRVSIHKATSLPVWRDFQVVPATVYDALVSGSGDGVRADVQTLAAAARGQVNAEVVDALATDTYAEPGQGAPPATTTLAVKLAWLYKALINKIQQTDDEYRLFNAAGDTVDQKAETSDDGTTFTRQRFVSGP